MRSGLWCARAPTSPPASRRLLNCTALIGLSPVFASWPSPRLAKDRQRIFSGSPFIGETGPATKSHSIVDERDPRSRWRNVTANALRLTLAFAPTGNSNRPVPRRQIGQSAPDAKDISSSLTPALPVVPAALQADFFLGRVTCGTVMFWLIPQFSHWNECNSAPSSRSGCAWRWCKDMVPRHTGHVGCSSPASGVLDEKGIIGVSPGLPRHRRIGMPVRVCSQRKRVLLCGKSLRQRNIGLPLWTRSNRDHGVWQRQQAYRPACLTRGA
jgi:hypothetical protein